jgi:hypothetical protein
VGATVSMSSHEAFAAHGQDLVIILASHVGYDPETFEFGMCKRWLTADESHSTNCGKIAGTLAWCIKPFFLLVSFCHAFSRYIEELRVARSGIFFFSRGESILIKLDNQLCDASRHEGIILRLEGLIKNQSRPLAVCSTSQVFAASDSLSERLLPFATEAPQPIGEHLTWSHFFFRKAIAANVDGPDQLSANLFPLIPQIICSAHPMLSAAKVNTMKEFERLYRSCLRADCFRRRNLLVVSGLNIDLHNQEQRNPFPGTQFVPWAAFHQRANGEQRIIEQKELHEALMAQNLENPHAVDLEKAIKQNLRAPEVLVREDAAVSGLP